MLSPKRAAAKIPDIAKVRGHALWVNDRARAPGFGDAEETKLWATEFANDINTAHRAAVEPMMARRNDARRKLEKLRRGREFFLSVAEELDSALCGYE